MDGYMEAKSRCSFIKFWLAFYRDRFEAFPTPEPTDNEPLEPDSNEDSDNDDGGDDEGNAEAAPELSEAPKTSKKGGEKPAVVSDNVILILKQGMIIKHIKKVCCGK